MLKIAIVTPTFPPYAGGIGNVAAYHARELTKRGHEVKIFTPEYETIKQEEVTGVAIHRVPPTIKYGNAAFLPSLGKLLEGYDIIHIHYPFFGGTEPIWLRSKKLKRKFGTKIVLHYHMDVVGTGAKHLLFSLHRSFLLKRFITMADSVVVTSVDYAKHSNIAKYIERSPEKFLEIPNGVDTIHFQPQQKDPLLLDKHGILLTDKVAVFVGGLDRAHYFKGVPDLIEAMARLRTAGYNWKLLIVGEGDMKSEYESLVEQLNIKHRIVFGGYVPNPDLPRYYNLADVVILPSIDKSEAFGMVLVEAMACGKAIVASNLPGVRTVVEDGVNGYVSQPSDIQDLANKINHILTHDQLAAEFGVNGERKARRLYDWKQIGNQLERLYSTLCKTSTDSSPGSASSAGLG